MTKLNILIVEDNPDDRLSIEIAIEETYNLVASVSTVRRALQVVNKNLVDLVITDIRLEGEKTGVSLVNILAKKGIPCIIVTAFSDQAVYQKVNKSHLIAFLIKPFDHLTLLSTIDLASQNLLLTEIGNIESSDSNIFRNSFFIKKNKELIKILLRDIKWIQSEGNYSYIITKDKKFVIKLSLSKIMERLPSNNFTRIHRSYVINKEKVDDLNIPGNIVHIDGESIPIGRSFKATLLDNLNSLW